MPRLVTVLTTYPRMADRFCEPEGECSLRPSLPGGVLTSRRTAMTDLRTTARRKVVGAGSLIPWLIAVHHKPWTVP
jgi:hypothetical protein